MNRPGVSVYLAAVILPWACSTVTPPAASAPTPETSVASAPAASAPAAPASAVASAAGASEPAAMASASPASSAVKKQKLESGGRPLTIYSGPTQPVTVGQDGAVLRTESGAELRILAGAIAEARNVFLAVDRKARGTTGKIGDVYELPVQVPAQKLTTGGPSQTYDTYAEPFILKLPLPTGSRSANLAVERVEQDAKTKRLTSTWTVVPMAKIESADNGDKAVFELKTLPGAHVHLTTASAGEPTSK